MTTFIKSKLNLSDRQTNEHEQIKSNNEFNIQHCLEYFRNPNAKFGIEWTILICQS